VPAGIVFSASPLAVPVALAVTVGTSLIGASIAAIRPSRVRPAVALAESGVPRRRIGVARTVAGLFLVLGGVVLSVEIAHSPQAGQTALFVMLAMCLGTGLLAPVLLRVAAPVVRLFGGPGALAADHVAVQAKALSSALVPLVLAAAFAAVKVAMHTTAAHVTGRADPAAALWTDYSGTAVYTAFAAVAALNTLITVVLARRRDFAVARLAGGTRARVLAVVICEALIVMVTGLLVAAGVAAATLLPMLHAAFGTWAPWLPASYLLAGVGGVAAVVLAATVLPAAVSMRRPAIEAVT
jgi:putative ABC transport system permease protein